MSKISYVVDVLVAATRTPADLVAGLASLTGVDRYVADVDCYYQSNTERYGYRASLVRAIAAHFAGKDARDYFGADVDAPVFSLAAKCNLAGDAVVGWAVNGPTSGMSVSYRQLVDAALSAPPDWFDVAWSDNFSDSAPARAQAARAAADQMLWRSECGDDACGLMR